tara:strand:+ start:9431 stop:9973 length:543 start_codon:yes stop_codon:yes gene_type:complete
MTSEIDNVTDRATLAYLVNPHYNRSARENIKGFTPDELTQFNIDRRFYRKRIISLTRDMFKKNNLPENIVELHNSYVKQLIEYFKLGDRKDIIQEEYDGINEEEEDFGDMEYNIETANKEIFNIKEPVATMEKFVTIKKVNVEDNIVPKKKDINLKDPKLKTKGLDSKKKKKKDKNKNNI